MNIDLKIGELAKPIDTLIQEVSKGVSSLSEGTLRRWNEKRDLLHYINMCKIIEKMCKIIEKTHAKKKQPNTSSLGVEGGFLLNFLDKCKTVTDDDMQELWASILARESDSPGNFSQLIINSLENFRKQDAESFISLCGYVCEINNEKIPLIENVNHEVYIKNGINSHVLEHLCALNVIESDTFFLGSRGTTKPSSPGLNTGESISIFYFGEKLDYVNSGVRDSLNLGKITFTSIGKELLSISNNQQVDGFIDYLKHNWRWSLMGGSSHTVKGNRIIRT